MMLDYDWTNNPAAAAAAMMLFGEETNASHANTENIHHHNNQMLMNHYNNMDYFQQAHDHHQGIPTTALFSNAEYVGYHHPLVPIASRIGLDLGVRTYFATGSEGNDRGRRNSNMNMMIGRRRRRRIARCQAEGCGKDLTLAKHYHRRHKVCEYHSKASMVVTAGLSQRFCQQCSRFHILSEFDQGKRSCRKRLADHNRRRRKSQDLTTTSTSMSINTNPINNNNNNDSTSTSVAVLSDKNVNGNMIRNKSQFNSENLQIDMGTKLSEVCSSVTTHHDPQVHLDIFSAPEMELGLTASSSAVSTNSTTMQQNKSCNLSQLGEYRELGNRFPASWVDDEAEEQGMYHDK